MPRPQGAASPVMALTAVVFPEPLAPRRRDDPPPGNVKLTESRALMAPWDFLKVKDSSTV